LPEHGADLYPTAERERQWQEQVEERRSAEAERRRHPDDEDDDDDDEEADPPRAALDSKPAEPGPDPHDLINSEHQPAAIPGASFANAPLPEIKLDDVEAANYSTNV
jgi:hypothetical protein